MLMMRYIRNKKLLLVIFAALLLLGLGFLILGNKEQVAPVTEEIPGPTDSLSIAVNEYLREDGYDCQVGWNTFWIEYAYDFVPNYGNEEYLVSLISSCEGPLGGAGGNRPMIVISRTDSGYKVIGEANGESPLIEDTASEDDIPNILIVGDDAPPGNYDVSELTWNSEEGKYLSNERSITESEKKVLLNRYLESALTRDSVMQYAKEALVALYERDIALFSTYVHPTKGLSLCDQTWTPEQIKEQLEKKENVFCGYAEGSGAAINGTLEDHLLKFSRLNYLEAPRFAFSKLIGPHTGQIQYSFSSKPEKRPFMMYHFPYTSTYTDEQGNEVENEMSWQSLALVFDKADDGEWYIVGIISDQWSI